MDPTAALEGARMAADMLAQLLDIDESEGTSDPLAFGEAVQDAAEDLLTNFRSLDSWLSQGGFPPEPWQRKEDT